MSRCRPKSVDLDIPVNGEAAPCLVEAVALDASDMA